MTKIIIDRAGALIGGAAAYADALEAHVMNLHRKPTVIGRNRSLTPGWLFSREAKSYTYSRKIALNNAGFALPGGQRIVLLRNALHYATRREVAALGYRPGSIKRLEGAVVRAAARRAHRVVVPSTAMGNRVLERTPHLEARLRVRLHPVKPSAWAGAPPRESSILVPIVNAPYKRMAHHMSCLLAACDELDYPTGEPFIRLTDSPANYPQHIRKDKRIAFVGLLSQGEVDEEYARSAAVYYPPALESFGYPLAQARVNGRSVIAPATDQNLEIAGSALAAYQTDDVESLAAATSLALTTTPVPDPHPFDPQSYFDWLLEGAE